MGFSMVNNSKKNKKCYKKKYLFLMFLCLIKGDFETVRGD